MFSQPLAPSSSRAMKGKNKGSCTEACRPEEEDSASRKDAKQPMELQHAPCSFKGVVKTKIENQVTRTLLLLGALNHILKSYI